MLNNLHSSNLRPINEVLDLFFMLFVKLVELEQFSNNQNLISIRTFKSIMDREYALAVLEP